MFIMGLAVATVLLNVVAENQGERLKKQVQRFEVVFNMASDFAILNQQQLGLYVDQEKNTYAYLILDEEQKWQDFAVDKVFATHTLPENFSFELELNDLPWETDGSLLTMSCLMSSFLFHKTELKLAKKKNRRHHLKC